MKIPTIIETRLLVDNIKTSLKRSNDGQVIYDLSKDFSRAIAYLNNRMQSIAVILNSGDRITGFCEIEKDPNVNELLSICSFPELEAWKEFCLSNNLEIAEQIDPKLGQLIGQTNLPWDTDTKNALYSHYREALFSHHYVQALNLIKTITGKYPTEKSGLNEVLRLTNIVSDLYSNKLLLASENKDVVLVKKLVFEINEQGFKELQTGDLWRQSLQIAIEADIRNIAETYRLTSINSLKNILSTLNRDTKRYGLVLSEHASNQLYLVKTYIDEAEKLRIAQQDALVRRQKISETIIEAEDILRSSCTKIDDLEESKKRITFLIADADVTKFAFPQETIASATRAIQKLDVKMLGIRRAVIRQRVVKFAIVATIIFAVGWIVFIETLSVKKYGLLAKANSVTNMLVIEKLEPECEKDGLGLFSRNDHKEILRQAQNFIIEAKALESKVALDLLSLEKISKGSFALSNYVNTALILGQASELIPKLMDQKKLDYGRKISLVKSNFVTAIQINSEAIIDALKAGGKIQARSSILGVDSPHSEISEHVNSLTHWYNNYRQIETFLEFAQREKISSFSSEISNISEIKSKTDAVNQEVNILNQYLKSINSILAANSLQKLRDSFNELSGNSLIRLELRSQANKIDSQRITDEAFARSFVGLPPLIGDKVNKNSMDATNSAISNVPSSVIIMWNQINSDPVLSGKYFVYQIEFSKKDRMNERWVCNDQIILDGAVRNLKYWRILNTSSLPINSSPTEIDLSYVSNSGGISVAIGDDIKTAVVSGNPITKTVIDYLGLTTDLAHRDALYSKNILNSISSILYDKELDPWLRVYVFNKLVKLIELEPELFLYVNIRKLNALNARLKSALGDLDDYALLIDKVSYGVGENLVDKIFSGYYGFKPIQDAAVRGFIVESMIRDGIEIVAVAGPSGNFNMNLKVENEDLFIFDPADGGVVPYVAKEKNNPFSIIVRTSKNIKTAFKERFPDLVFKSESIFDLINN
jgi:hypothetical protein